MRSVRIELTYNNVFPKLHICQIRTWRCSIVLI
nr:MAG TPA: hypothetical protein [Bacteriophage sp.]